MSTLITRARFDIAAAAIAAASLAGCGADRDEPGPAGGGDGGGGAGGGPILPSDDDQTAVQQALIEVEEGGTVELGPGRFTFTDELTLAVAGVTVRGAGSGEDGTVLDFAGQQAGGNALKITSDGVTVEALAVADPAGDGIRAEDVDRVTLRDLRVEWSTPASGDNGGYGLYPVLSRDVLVDRCLVAGASDAGIYVGQSERAIVRDSEARGNVAGIEIENTTDAEVAGNDAHDNTAGILVFNLPDLPVRDGKRARVHDNRVADNDLDNFAPGGLIALVPAGTGILVMASDDNEIHGNTIEGNDSIGLAVISYCTTGQTTEDATYDPYAQGNWVHDNALSDNAGMPQGVAQVLLGKTVIGQAEVGEVVWDGVIDPAADPDDASLRNCFSGNGDARFLIIDAPHSGLVRGCLGDDYSATGEATNDAGPWTCERDPLGPVELQ